MGMDILMLKKRLITLVIALTLGCGSWAQASSLWGSKTEAERLFGYNPHYSEIPQVTPGDKKVALLILHGFGCPRGEYYKKFFPNDARYLRVTFDFKDTLFHNKRSLTACTLSPLETIKGIRSINVGQVPDAEVALYGLIQLWKAGYVVVLFGHSRGGAAAIRIADMLVHPDTYCASWKKLGMTKEVIVYGSSQDATETIIDIEKIELLKASIIKIYLEKPLLNINELLNEKLRGLMDRFTAFSKTEQQPLDLLKGLVDQNISMHFTLAQRDNVLYNWYDSQLMELVAQAGWTLTQADEDHNDVKETRNIFNSYLASLNLPVPIVTAV